MNKRSCEIKRQTRETDIFLELNLDGLGNTEIDSGVPFLNHMLTLFGVHGFFDLTIKAEGDTEVDDHHTVEDIGICLGQAFKHILKDFSKINRYGSCSLPMDEARADITVDLSNRSYLHYEVDGLDSKTGTFDTVLVKEFLRALSLHGGMTLHIEVPYGENTHHILEAVFKALGRSLDQATALNTRLNSTLSSKGSLTS
ncbi:MAG: imidazoleglycerol-phosphate dehydratase HisB [Thermodesulfobacteriota bacterium]